MFRQMAHFKCLRQGISNFNETLDLAYELFLISSRKKNLKKTKILHFTEKSTFSNWDGGRVTNTSFIGVINSYKILYRAISYQNECKKHGMNRLKEF